MIDFVSRSFLVFILLSKIPYQQKKGKFVMYLDPGFGSMLIQMLVASLAALAVGFGIFRQRIIAFFSKKKSEVKDSDEIETNETGEMLETDMNEEIDIAEAGEDSDDR